MKYVNFKTLKIKNFLSIGNTPVCIDFNTGLHIITGVNRDKEDRRNGVGKSTIADALFFSLFGTTIRELKKEFIINNITQDSCEVQVEFDIKSNNVCNNYTIIRTLSPSKLLLFRDSQDITLDSISNTNKYIETLLSSSPEIFKNCVLLTLNDTIPFMLRGKADKRKFIEQIFNLQIFSAMSSYLREDLNNTKKDIDIELAKLTEIKNSITKYQNQKEVKSKEQDNKVTLINKKIADNNAIITKIESDLLVEGINQEEKNLELDKFNKGLTKVELAISETKEKILSKGNDIKNRKDVLSKIGTKEQVCPTCLRPLSEHDFDKIEQEKKKIKEEVLTYSEECSVLVSGLQGNEQRLSKIKQHIANISKELIEAAKQETQKIANKKRIGDLQALNEQLNDSIKNITSDTSMLDDLIKDANERKVFADDIVEKLKKKMDLLDTVKFVVSEEGVKSFLVKRILQTFNSKLAYYLKKLDSNSICIFNEYFEEEILNEKGKLCSYNNFSGAERKAIDLSCLFSFIDMRRTQGDVHYNISLYDELFDTSLDQRGVELVIDILKERVSIYGESIFIISHRKESIKAVDGNVIFLEKRNGITKRVNFVD